MPHLSINVSQQRQPCVLDSSLMLSQYGLRLVQALGEVLELWVARELWHILDNPSFYLTQPELSPAELSLEPSAIAPQTKSQTLRHWERFRAETPPADLNLFWIGDRPADSFLPRGCDPHLVERWEALARSLEAQLPTAHAPTASHALAAALRDTLALAAVLDSALILTYQPSDGPSNSAQPPLPPKICLTLEQWGIPCQQLDGQDAIAAIERENLLRLIISTGCSKLLWTGLHLVIFHLVLPAATTTEWSGAQGFWYQL